MSNYDHNNVFAKIIKGQIPATKVYEDDAVLAFNDVAPAAAKHIIVVPKGEYISFNDFITKADSLVIANFFTRVKQIANDAGLATTGYRIISNHGKDASQSVAHFHIHILGGEPLGGLLAQDRLIR